MRADLGERSLEPLPHGGGAREHRHASRGRDPHDARLERPAPRALEAVREPDAGVTALAARLRLASREIVPAGRLHHLCLARRIIAGVIFAAGAGAGLERLLIGHLLWRDEIAAADLGAVEAEPAREAIEAPLHGGRRL